jgi:hypothetical protein
VEREWLAERLACGDSIEAIAREVGRDPSTVSYWARKHGLNSSHAPRHAARGPIERELLSEIVACELSIRDIADVFERGTASIRHWLDEYGLETARTSRLRVSRTPVPADAGPEVRMCPDHGPSPFVVDRDGYRRCRKCRVDAVARRRDRRAFDAHRGSWRRLRHLRFRRAPGSAAVPPLDPGQKSFTIRNGDTRSLERMRREACKCVLLCANCHAQVEAGAADLPVRSNADGACRG